MRKDFWDIAAHAHKRHFSLTLQTNGTLVDDEAIKKLKEHNFFDVHVSLLWATPKTHDALMQSNGAFDKVIGAIKLLRKNNIAVMVKTTLTKQNFSEMKDILKISKRFKCQQVMSPVLNPKNDGSLSPYDFSVREKQLKEYYAYLFSLEPKDKKKYLSAAGEGMMNCRAGRTGFSINPKGDVCPCVGLPVSAGNIRTKSFKEIWDNSSFIDRMRTTGLKDLPACSKCEFLEHCMRCKGIVYLEEGNLTGVSKSACQNATIVKEVMEHEEAKV